MDVAHQLVDEVVADEGVLATMLLLDLLEGDRRRVVAAQVLPQSTQIPFADRLVGHGLVHQARDERLHEGTKLRLHVLALQDPAALAVDGLALTRHHVVVLQDVLTDLEVAGLHLMLSRLDGTRHDAVLQGQVLRVGTRSHDALGHARVEQAHQVVFHRQVETGLARVPLATASTTQLVVNTTRLVALRTEHVQAAQLTHLLALSLHGLLRVLKGHGPRLAVLLRVYLRIQALGGQILLRDDLRVTAQHNVGTTTGHVRGHRDRALATSHRDDLGLAGVLLGVEHLVRDVLLLEHLREQLGLFDRGGTDEDGLAGLVTLDNVLDDRVELALLRRVDEVGLVLAGHRLVRGDRDDVDLVGRGKLGGLGLGRTGHARARTLGVEAEVVLQRDRGQRLVLGLNLHAFLGLDRLVHAVVVAAARQDATRVLVDDKDLTGVHDVVAIPEEQLLRTDRVVEEADERGVRSLVQVLHAQLVLDLVDARLQDADSLLLLVDLVVLVARE